VTSRTTKQFRALYAKLPRDIQSATKKAFGLWRENPAHPGLRFKQVRPKPPVFSVRITRDHRALGVKADKAMIWFWIGSHQEYDVVLSRL
jgi:hypothetical protein